MKIKASDLYRGLRQRIAPKLQGNDWKRFKGMLGWYRPQGDEFLGFWFQCDKWGWEPEWGSRFTLEFQISSEPEIGLGDMQRRERYFRLLTKVEQEEIRYKNNEIIRGLPGAVSGLAQTIRESDGTEIALMGFIQSLKPHHPSEDVWLHYGKLEDVEYWGRYFEKKLQTLLERYVATLGVET